MSLTASPHRLSKAGAPETDRHATATLAAAVLGFFVITLDATIVNVALPSIRDALGGGITGLEWVVDAYTLMFAALLLSAGSLSDRIGARRAFSGGLDPVHHRVADVRTRPVAAGTYRSPRRARRRRGLRSCRPRWRWCVRRSPTLPAGRARWVCGPWAAPLLPPRARCSAVC
ncbi:MFS transporter [Streptomyces sp. NPDC005507]|uniref:MFS transporter n=1 Tax=Streptomyces sp. NPDC005507 TaxID=3154885 RepID=UPI0033BC460B